MTGDDIIKRIKAAYPDAEVTTDGADCSFSATVTSSAFAGLSMIKRQQPLLALFKEEIGSGELHALSLVAKTPAEAEADRQ